MAKKPKPPYIEEVEERGNLKVWIVDGGYIRGHIDEEFTNFGQHYAFPYIPIDELWIDQEAQHDERRFFIDHLLMEHRLMAKGVPYDQALAEADREEHKERRRAGDVGRLTRHGQKLPDGKDVHERLWKKLENGVSVWIVNGRLVRSVFDIDFTAGGHDYVYEFVPQKEVWIDDAIEEKERGYVLLHELHERNLMATGWPYNKAHNESSRLEYHCRHHPDELHEALSKEGWA
jgi:transposase InsO family protein